MCISLIRTYVLSSIYIAGGLLSLPESRTTAEENFEFLRIIPYKWADDAATNFLRKILYI